MTNVAGATKAAPLEVGRWGSDPVRFVWLAAAVALFMADARAWQLATSSGFVLPQPGADFILYRDAAARFLGGGGFYHPSQLAGPYDVWVTIPVLYPPTLLPLLAAFTVIPALLWWIVPLAIVGACAWSLRPRPLAWLVIAGLILWPASAVNAIWTGNPSMWCVAALAIATTGRTWAAPFVFLKPTLGLFALWGIRTRAWWIGLSVFAIVSLAFLPLWFDYATSLLNARSAGWTYQLWHVPLMLTPVVAWLGRR